MYVLELGGLIIIVILQYLIVHFNLEGSVRVATGFIFLTFLPGYSLLAAHYRSRRINFGALEHIVLSIPVSLAFNTIVGTLLNNFNIHLIPELHVIWMGLILLVLCLPSLYLGYKNHQGVLKYLPVLGGIIFAAIIFGLFTYIMPGSTLTRPDTTFTSLSILDAEKRAINYPSKVLAGETLRIYIQVSLIRGSNQEFILRSAAGEEYNIYLKPGEDWQKPFDFIFEEAGLYKLSWNLHRADDPPFERSVHLWLSVY